MEPVVRHQSPFIAWDYLRPVTREAIVADIHCGCHKTREPNYDRWRICDYHLAFNDGAITEAFGEGE